MLDTRTGEAPGRSPNQLRALVALSIYPLIAMTRNVATVAFGFLFPVVFLLVFGLVGDRGSTLRLGITPGDTRLPLYATLAQVPGLDFVEADGGSWTAGCG
jgi:ABC-2 type transport system permease protein